MDGSVVVERECGSMGTEREGGGILEREWEVVECRLQLIRCQAGSPVYGTAFLESDKFR